MPPTIIPGAVWMPGRNAGYRAGRSAMRCHVHHYTVGVDSTGIGLDGYFHLLLPKHGVAIQFAELDAVTYHAGEWNDQGPGTELERLSDAEPATPDQIYWGGLIDAFLRDHWGIADAYLSDSAGRVGEPFYGFLNHRNLTQSQPHSDYWHDSEVAQMRGGKPGPDVDVDQLIRDLEEVHGMKGLSYLGVAHGFVAQDDGALGHHYWGGDGWRYDHAGGDTFTVGKWRGEPNDVDLADEPWVRVEAGGQVLNVLIRLADQQFVRHDWHDATTGAWNSERLPL